MQHDPRGHDPRDGHWNPPSNPPNGNGHERPGTIGHHHRGQLPIPPSDATNQPQPPPSTPEAQSPPAQDPQELTQEIAPLEDAPMWVVTAREWDVSYTEDNPWEAELSLDITVENGDILRSVVALNPGNIPALIHGLEEVAEAQGISSAYPHEDNDDEEPTTLRQRFDPLRIQTLTQNKTGLVVLLSIVGLLLMITVITRLF